MLTETIANEIFERLHNGKRMGSPVLSNEHLQKEQIAEKYGRRGLYVFRTYAEERIYSGLSSRAAFAKAEKEITVQ